MKTAHFSLMAVLMFAMLAGAAQADGWADRRADWRGASGHGAVLADNRGGAADDDRDYGRSRREAHRAARQDRRDARDDRRDRAEFYDDDDGERFGVGYERRRELIEQRRRDR